MIDLADAASILARERGEIIAVPHPYVERYWREGSGAPERDMPPPTTEGQGADFAVGVALARPDERVMALDVDEALLSNLGALVTISDAAPENFVHVLFQRGVRTGPAGLPLPGGMNTDFATIARGAGYRSARIFDDLEELAGEITGLLNEPGPTMIVIKVGLYSPREAPEPPSPRYDMSRDVREYRRRLEET